MLIHGEEGKIMAKILIVEDHYMSRQVLSTLFDSMGHRVLEAKEGWSALVIARCEQPDLVITDILLPAMNGIELAQRLRAMPSMEGKPIIFYTATSRLPEEIDLGEAFGTCYVIPKPSDPRFILDAVNKVLGNTSAQFPVSAIPKTLQRQSVSSLNAGLQLAVLMDLSHSLVALRDLEQLLNVASRAVREFVRCRYSLLAFLGEDGKMSYYFGHADGDEDSASRIGLIPAKSIEDYVLTELSPILIPASPAGAQTEKESDTVLIVPFSTPSRVYGWISLMGKLDSTSFTSGDEEAAITLSTKAALAYENMLLVSQLQEKERYLEQLVQERTAELEQARMDLITMQKLESLGVLAGGIAHNFNNALTAIIGHTQLAKMQTDPGEKIYRNLDLAEKACMDARSLTRQLLTFAKGGKPMKTPISLPDLVRDTADFVLADSTVRYNFNHSPDLRHVDADQGQIAQVLSNLLLNASEAMVKGGDITITAENLSLDSNTSFPLSAGDYVKLSIADEGTGILPEDQHRVFDPYFTTKDKGHGLGLATAYSIIKNHGGYISLESKEGSGTVFHILLPTTEEISLPQQEIVMAAKKDAKILLIEDNEYIAQSLAELLEINGYTVDSVGDGNEGIELYAQAMQDGKKYDAVIMDLTIPGGMGGKETIKHLRGLDPQVIAFVISGYSNDPVMSNYREYGFSGTFAKPFNYKDIVVKLQQLIKA